MAINENKFNLNDSEVNGDITGRDKITINNYAENQNNYIEGLYNKYHNQNKSNKIYNSDDFNYYTSTKENQAIIGLKAKLKAGNIQYIEDFARSAKERFHKKLLKNAQFSEIAQKINVLILSKVETNFYLHVYPLICKNENQQKIDNCIEEKVIIPIKEEMGSNYFDYHHTDIMGMIYFLTGNCHLKWSK